MTELINENKNSEGKGEPEQLAETVSSALRGSKYGIFEQLICQHLIQATVTSDSLRKAQLISDAALMLDPEQKKRLGIDANKALTVNSVCLAFMEKTETRIDHVNTAVSIKFGFEENEENYNKHISHWQNEFEYFSGLITKHLKPAYRLSHDCGYVFGVFPNEQTKAEIANAVKTDYCPNCRSDLSFHSRRYYHIETKRIQVVLKEPYWSFFYEATKYLTLQGYIKLKHGFLYWCLPFAMDTMRLLTESVKPEIYNQIAKLMIKPTSEGQK